MKLRAFSTINKRREFIEKNKKLRLDSVKIYPIGLEKAQFTNCENMIGATQIPLGLAGSLIVNGQYTSGEYYIPLATTEGALIASVNRGAKAISQNGGATVFVENVGVTRGPVFKTTGINESMKCKEWLENHISDLKVVASKSSKHLNLKKLGVRIVGKNIFVRFYFDTAEAMGMNMVTIATAELAKFIEQKLRVKCISVAGNFDIDKKPAWLNFISGRGKRVWAEATLSEDIIKQTLKTTASKIYEVWLTKCMLGSALAGSMGFNAHAANIIAAIFTATGQDIAHVVEGSLGITTTEIENNDLYISVYLPDLMVGTIGGGTGLPSQREALSIMGIGLERNGSYKLAEICGAAVLAGEISLLASLAEGSLAQSHQRLARGIKK